MDLQRNTEIAHTTQISLRVDKYCSNSFRLVLIIQCFVYCIKYLHIKLFFRDIIITSRKRNHKRYTEPIPITFTDQLSIHVLHKFL